METETATIPEMGTAIESDDAVDRISAILDITEASEVSEQADENVETEPASENEVETPEEQYFEINGEQISLEDLKSGFLRQSDYTRKTTELSQQRKHYQENQRDINQLRTEALAGLETLKMQIAAEFRTAEYPDFDYLAQEEPAEFIRQQHIWQKRENAVRQLYDAEAQIKQKAAEYEAEQHKAQLQESSAKFFQKYPELQESGKSDEIFSEITSYLIDEGFSKEEISSVSDYRIISILYQNVLAQKTQKSIPTVVEKISQKPVLSQKQTSRPASDYRKTDFDKFNQTRSGNDAIAALSHLF